MSRKWIVRVCLIVLAVALIGLVYHVVRPGKHPKAAPGSSYTPTTGATEQTNKVTISNYAFSPADIKVKVGTTVTWTNLDLTGYTVTEDDGQKGPGSDMIAQNQTYSYKFTKAGLFHYHDSLDPQVSGTVTVQ